MVRGEIWAEHGERRDLGREGREERFGQGMVRGEIWAEKGGRRDLGRAW